MRPLERDGSDSSETRDGARPDIRNTRRGRRAWVLATIIVACAALIGGGITANRYLTTMWTDVAAAPAPADTALKGFIPFAPEPGQQANFAPDALPYSMEWFYLPVNDIVTGPGTYDWTTLDKWLDSIAARGHQSVFRLYLDYPGRPTGVPQYLIDAGIDTSRRYTQYGNNNISFSPDYDDPRIQQMLLDLVAALGARYDGDPRIGYITQGLIGFWGEGHTYPMDGWEFPQNWIASDDTQVKLLAAWDDAFDITPTLVRYPTVQNEPHDVGYHDDSFGWDTLPTTDWHFLAKMDAAGAAATWQTAPIGGEIYPEIQSCIFNQPSNCPNQEVQQAEGRSYDIPGSIEATHASWLINQAGYVPGYTGDARDRALAAHTSLGYTFRVTEMGMKHDLDRSRTVSARIVNDGIAPFYYDWPLDLALLDSSGNPVAVARADSSVKGLQPGAEATTTARLDLADVPRGRYDVALRVANPVKDGTPVRFANAGQTDGTAGWVILGQTRV